MTPRKMPGKALIESLNGLLDPGMEFDEAEQQVLALIELTTDRLAPMRQILADELTKDEPSTRRVSELSAEVRLLEKQLAGWCDSLRPKAPAAKSWQHQKAANARWLHAAN